MAADETDLIGHLAERICRLHPHRRIRTAVDGVDGAGKSTFAAALARGIEAGGRPAVLSSVDGFHHPRAVRYRRGRDSPDGFYEDSYDYRALHAQLLDPLGPGGDGRFRRSVFDHRTDQPVTAPLEQAPPYAVLVLDGLFLHRPQLRHVWDFSVFLRVGFEETFARMAVRDGCPPDPHAAANRRYVEGQRRYLRECQPERRATVVVDNTDVTAPRLVAI